MNIRTRTILAAISGTLACIAIMLAGASLAFGAPPGIKGGKFEVTCQYAQSAQVDPIVSFGIEPSEHLHDFFGNRNVTSTSTADALRGLSTSCKVADDTAAYWVPAAYRTDTGERVLPVKAFEYYFGDPAGTGIEAPPAGAEIVAGNHNATAPQGKAIISWSCGNGGNKSPVRDSPYDCRPYSNNQGVVEIVKFPYCWDGVGLTTASFAYGDSTGICRAPFTHRLPQLQQHVHYGYGHGDSRNFQRGDLLTLSSGPSYTLHADWLNSWNQTRLETLVSTCLAVRKDCGFLSK